MSLDGGWFAARVADGATLDLLAARARALAPFYGVPVEVRALPGAGAIVGRFGPRGDGGPPWVWGDAAGLDPDAPRRFTGPGAALSWTEDRVWLATATSDLTALYAAGDLAWSTHAVAAAWLAEGGVALRPLAVVERLAFDHCPGDATAVRGVTAVAPATVVTVERGAARVRSCWTERERWEPVGEGEAQAVAERLLVASLAERLAGRPARLGLSAGADSRVVAVALREAGAEVDAYTWGDAGSPEVAGAREVAGRLRLAHEVLVPRPLAAEAARADAEHAATWSDGCLPGGVFGGTANPRPPSERGQTPLRVTVTGQGGEIGRAFHYQLVARSHRAPSRALLLALWRPDLALPRGVGDAARDHVQACAEAALDTALAAGVEGWRALDVVYAQQRMRRWCRDRLRPTDGVLLPALLEPRLAAALVSLPLEERLTDGFHRRFLEARVPELAPPAPPGQRAGVPRVARRLAAAMRRRRAQPPTDASPGAATAPAWRAEALLHAARSPVAAEALGEPFAVRLAQGVEARDPGAWATAERMQPHVLLAEALPRLVAP